MDIASSSALYGGTSVAVYAASKHFNAHFSQSQLVEYDHRHNKYGDKAGKDTLDLDVLTVFPSSVKSSMNSGRYTLTITSD